jgi:hypothetical protein
MKLFKRFLVGACCLVVALGFTGCFKAVYGLPDYRSVRAFICESYYSKFDARDFTLEDFNLNNAKSISYFHYPVQIVNDYPNAGDVTVVKPEEKYILIKLRKTGKKHAEQAVAHLGNLGFVERAEFSYRGGNVGMHLI